MTTKTVVCAVVINQLGQVLPYTCQSPMSRCDEWAQANLTEWDKMKQLGARVMQAEIVVDDSRPSFDERIATASAKQTETK